jgi:hypothetical protein
MKKALFAATLVAALWLCAAPAHAEPLPCGLPDARPLWVDFGDNSVTFRFQLFGKSGIVVATNGTTGPAQLRAQGAQTVYWHMQLKKLVGTPTAPADPSTIGAAADALVQQAISSTGCDQPVIALNELWSAYKPTPWLYENALYRHDVLTLLQAIAARGGVPFLLVPGPATGSRAPFVDGDARVWWQEVAQVAHIVREMHFNAPYIYAKGPIVGARTRRIAMRTAVNTFLGIGVPPDRLGLLLGFQSGRGKGGREGLEPRSAWLEIVKQDTLSAREVAGELGIGSIWSWGWGTFGPESADADKPAAACVYLWIRDSSLCDGPAAAGAGFNASLTLGQIALPPGIQCSTGLGDITVADVDQLAGAIGGARRLALVALLSRLIYEDEGAAPSAADVDRAESGVIDRNFGGDRAAYETALNGLGLDPTTGRSIVADQLARQTYAALVQIRHATSSPDAYILKRERLALRYTVCLRDDLPAAQDFNWAGILPSLRVPSSSVSIRAQRYVVKKGAHITLSGRVDNERASEVVTVYARTGEASSFVAVGSAKVGAGGAWRFSVAPRAGTYYRALSRGAASPAILVRVRGH